VICESCLREPEDGRLDGAPVCLPCADLIIHGDLKPPALVRLCATCGNAVRGGRDDPVPVCRDCARARLDRAMAVEQAPSLLDVLPPLDERWRPRPLRPVELSDDQAREQLRALRERFREDGKIEPPPPPRRHWLDDP
jgi:hypothetical protein